MARDSAFDGSEFYRPAARSAWRDTTLPAHFGDAAVEYGALRTSAGLLDRSDRGLAVVRGVDRRDWLHNLVSNAVKTLEPGGGCYAFALDVRGRVLFDLNILADTDLLRLDLDIAALPAALQHLDRYHLSERVELADESAAHARLAVIGPDAPRIAAELGAARFGDLPQLSWTEIAGGARLVRVDFGVPGFELHVPREAAIEWWNRCAASLRVRPVGLEAWHALRIESAIPWLGAEIDERVVAPETGQIARAISYHKGCYLGQEVVERMRSHGSQARRLVRLRGDELTAPAALPVALRSGDAEVGRVTSLMRHPARDEWIGLGYARSAVPDGAELLAEGCGIVRIEA